MKANKTSYILKMYGLTDDKILEIATEATLGDASNLLKEALPDKWRMTTLEAMKTVKELREELR